MSKKYMMDAQSLKSSTSNVKEILNKKSISLSILICALALAIILLSSWIEDKSSPSYMGGNTVAVLMLIAGFYRLINKRSQLIYVPTESVIIAGSFYLDSLQLERVKRDLLDHPEADLSDVKFVKSGNTRLDYVVSRDGNFVGAQLFQYIPYNFEPVTDVVCYEDEQAQNLAMFLLKNHGKL